MNPTVAGSLIAGVFAVVAGFAALMIDNIRDTNRDIALLRDRVSRLEGILIGDSERADGVIHR